MFPHQPWIPCGQGHLKGLVFPHTLTRVCLGSSCHVWTGRLGAEQLLDLSTKAYGIEWISTLLIEWFNSQEPRNINKPGKKWNYRSHFLPLDYFVPLCSLVPRRYPLFPHQGTHRALHLHFALIYLLNSKASWDPYFAFVYLVQSIFTLLLPENLADKVKCSQNVIDKYKRVVLCIL